MDENKSNTDYLSHHGIEGMRWGKRNGPPYPLSQAKHNKVVYGELTEKQKKKVLKDPKKIIKHQTELTRDEIEEAIRKLDAVNEVKKRVNKNSKFKRQSSGLTRKQRRMAKNPRTLLKNAHKFSNDDLQKALNYLKTQEDVFDLKMRRVERPKKILDTVSNYFKTVSTLLSNVNSLRDNTVTTRGKGFKNEERRKLWMIDNEQEKLNKLIKNKDESVTKDEINKLRKKIEDLEKSMGHDSMSEENSLMHYGVKGMKWRNHIYAQPVKRMNRDRIVSEYHNKNKYDEEPVEDSFDRVVNSARSRYESNRAQSEFARRRLERYMDDQTYRNHLNDIWENKHRDDMDQMDLENRKKKINDEAEAERIRSERRHKHDIMARAHERENSPRYKIERLKRRARMANTESRLEERESDRENRIRERQERSRDRRRNRRARMARREAWEALKSIKTRGK